MEYSIPDVKNGTTRDAVVTEYTMDKSGYMLFPFKGISPRMMKAPITATLYGTYQGVEYSYTMQYAVTRYCNSLLNTSKDNELKTLVVDLMNFGTAHQKYAGHDVDNLINADLTDAQKALASTYELELNNIFNGRYTVIEGATAAFKGVALTLQEAVLVRVIIECADTKDAYMRFTLGGKNYDVPSSEWVPYSGGANQYEEFFNNLRSSQMSAELYACDMRGDAVISNTMRYSIESYAAQNINSAKLKDLLTAMMYYGKSAAAYFS